MSDTTTSTSLAQEPPSPRCTCCPAHGQNEQPVDSKRRDARMQNFVNVTVRSAGVADRTRLFARSALEQPNLFQKYQFKYVINGCSLYEVTLLYIHLEFKQKEVGVSKNPPSDECLRIMREWKLQAWFDDIGEFVDIDEGSWQQIVYIADKFRMIRCDE
ncbi:hypothetical protein BD410DRAFT_479078 [Rickenella mellea]|uniref:Uncharacterized protein n=1 Tax=Rickenella mellea TaxID=50990 RepID=A0A4Y7QIP8_9AGAM|nr:hypothetical protein BD410DRAFT_479078 [Rickenella mellea]